MAKIKRTAKKLQEELEAIANGEVKLCGSYGGRLARREKAKIKAEEMKKFLKAGE